MSLLNLILLLASTWQALAIESVVLRNGNGIEVHLIQTGAIVQRLLVPDATGQTIDVAAGFDDPNLYLNNTYSPYFGAIIGRVMSRISNATFELDGQRYNTLPNENGNTQHGGPLSWAAKNWTITQISSDLGDAAQFSLTSPAGDQGFPSTINATVIYTLTPTNELILEFEATSDGPSPIGMISHNYFNLDGPGSNKTILDHELFINATYYTPLDVNSVPYGTFAPVEGTPYDFRTQQTIGSRINNLRTDFPPPGYDVNYVAFGFTGEQSVAATHDCVVFDEPQLVATVSGPESGIALDVLAQTPGIELYTGNHLNGSLVGKGGQRYPEYGAFALEAEMFPNFINEPNFAKCIVTPDSPYQTTQIWRFYNASDGLSAGA